MNSIGLCKLRGGGGGVGSTGLSKLSRGGWDGWGLDSFQAPIRRVIYVSTVIYY